MRWAALVWGLPRDVLTLEVLSFDSAKLESSYLGAAEGILYDN